MMSHRGGNRGTKRPAGGPAGGYGRSKKSKQGGGGHKFRGQDGRRSYSNNDRNGNNGGGFKKNYGNSRGGFGNRRSQGGNRSYNNNNNNNNNNNRAPGDKSSWRRPVQTHSAVRRPQNAGPMSKRDYRKYKQARRASKPHFDAVSQLLTLCQVSWRAMSASDRHLKINAVLNGCKGKLGVLACRTDTSRALQMIVKFGNYDQRKRLFQEIEDCEVKDSMLMAPGASLSSGESKATVGNRAVMFVSDNRAGHFLMLRFLQHGGEGNTTGRAYFRDKIIEAFRTSMYKYIFHAHAAKVLDYVYASGSKLQRAQVMREFYSKSASLFKEVMPLATFSDILAQAPDQTEKQSREQLKSSGASPLRESKARLFSGARKLLRTCIDKQALNFRIVHTLAREYLEASGAVREGVDVSKPLTRDSFVYPEELNERQSLLDTLAETPMNLLHSQDGIRVLCAALDAGNAKVRRRLLKGLKSSAEDPEGQAPFAIHRLLCDQDAFRLVWRLCLVVDDTRLLGKTVVKDILAAAQDSNDSFQQRLDSGEGFANVSRTAVGNFFRVDGEGKDGAEGEDGEAKTMDDDEADGEGQADRTEEGAPDSEPEDPLAEQKAVLSSFREDKFFSLCESSFGSKVLLWLMGPVVDPGQSQQPQKPSGEQKDHWSKMRLPLDAEYARRHFHVDDSEFLVANPYRYQVPKPKAVEGDDAEQKQEEGGGEKKPQAPIGTIVATSKKDAFRRLTELQQQVLPAVVSYFTFSAEAKGLAKDGPFAEWGEPTKVAAGRMVEALCDPKASAILVELLVRAAAVSAGAQGDAVLCKEDARTLLAVFQQALGLYWEGVSLSELRDAPVSSGVRAPVLLDRDGHRALIRLVRNLGGGSEEVLRPLSEHLVSKCAAMEGEQRAMFWYQSAPCFVALAVLELPEKAKSKGKKGQKVHKKVAASLLTQLKKLKVKAIQLLPKPKKTGPKTLACNGLRILQSKM